jgi:nucleoside-diphosphate-sugar epimerase
VAVTGGSGKAGRWVVRRLQEAGHDVTNIDRAPSDEVHTYRADLTDLGQVYGVLEGREAVVHLAAIPWPGEHSPEVVFRNNVLSTFNVLQASSVLGIKKVVNAGSESALGFPFMVRRFGPRYLPIDEQHPLLAQDAYGIGKIAEEEAGRGFARRDPSMSIISLRFSLILLPEDYVRVVPRAQADPAAHEFNLWAYVDVRDAAEACRLAVESRGAGFDACYVAAPDTLMSESTAALVRSRFPGDVHVAASFSGTASPLSCRHASEVLGWHPAWTWERALAEGAA